MTRLRFIFTATLTVLAALLLPWRRRSVGQFRAKFVTASKPVRPKSGYAFTRAAIKREPIVRCDPSGDMTLGYTEFTYTLMRRGNEWQWRTADGREMSPVFDSAETAAAFHPNMGHTVSALVVERIA